MKQEDLESLILDRHLGELPDEVAALLDAYLSRVPESDQLVASLEKAAGIADAAITQDPALVRNIAESIEAPRTDRIVASANLTRLVPVFSALAGIVFALFVGFQWGVRSPSTTTKSSVSERESAPSTTSPWARYNMGDLARQSTQAAILPEK